AYQPAAPAAAPQPAPVAAPAPEKPAAAPSRSRLPLLLAAVMLLAVGVGGYFALRSPQVTAAEQLTRAEQAQGDDRVDALVKVASLPDATEAQLARAGALLVEAKAWDAALTLCDGWLQKNPKSLDGRLTEAKAAVQNRKAKRAETAIREASTLAPNDARPDALMAELRELQGETGAALEAWTKAVAKAPNNTQYLARQGYWLSQGGRLDEAEAALTKATRRKGDAAAVAELGFVKYRKEQKDEALRILRGVVKEKPELLEGHYYLATVLFAKGDLAGARAEYLAADGLAGADTRPLTALCEMEQMQQTSELEAAKKLIRERFPKEADALLSKCAAAAPAP
ncbi:MAG: tetratricopeptide repeat protein, partial [Myxococcota bacterium]